ncbi:uncharacterized protein STEHIDRAFT_151573 [Stereum hirsutum FP-91666 SS1]|uniref:uncharacterized protein n=1 Tax=Stereum hirsutum (strain FP-91666) TaxID=721885 RepID=UPI000440C31B|nr:uncharacterized protein STEHIDRAFT_151573 [Stereum hirsutum FP-91666 SS1]EIM92238.1 hypothetical protein STEHIDRAFT_151573 [Stereum hirsutum FP-91666 SS1]
MPPKGLAKPRSWGNRFDPLNQPRTPSPARQPASPLRIPATGFSASKLSPLQATFTPLNSSRRRDERTPHDASVFVGSLPSIYDPPELTRLLTEHLSGYPDALSVKVIRDARGGNGAAATRLIDALRSEDPPRAFLGRHLRYEPARALRSLLISYRKPVQAPIRLDGTPGSIQTAHSQPVELDLAFAMRLWRPSGSKYVSVLYNTEACDLPAAAGDALINKDETELCDAFDGEGIFLSPVAYDAETIHRLGAAFGPLEHFGPYRHEFSALHVPAGHGSFPSPHDSPRLPPMDPGCWEVKWQHRDDCVRALMTLRTVPHLTVTWAHNPQGGPSPAVAPNSARRQFPNPRTPYSPAYRGGAHLPSHLRTPTFSVLSDSGTGAGTMGSPVSSRLSPEGGVDAFQNTPALLSSPPSADGWVNMPPTVENSPVASHSTATRSMLLPPHALKLSERGGRSNTLPIRTSMVYEAPRPPAGDNVPEAKIITHSSVPIGQTSSIFVPPSSSPDHDRSGRGIDASSTISQLTSSDSSEVPEIPVMDMKSAAKRSSTPEFVFPRISCGANAEQEKYVDVFGTVTEYPDEEREGEVYDNFGRELDLSTIFVGGLEMMGPQAWDEPKVRRLFERYGKIEDIKYSRPLNKKSAFAFVRFEDPAAAAQAVSEQHNRVHEGRQIRVQIRTRNSHHRDAYRYGGRGRGRGRYQSNRYVDNPVEDGVRSFAGNGRHESRSSLSTMDSHLPSSESSFGLQRSNMPFIDTTMRSKAHRHPSNQSSPNSSSASQGMVPPGQGVDAAQLAGMYPASMMPPPGSVIPYPGMPGVGFYPHQPWYPPPFHPYAGGYMAGYPPPGYIMPAAGARNVPGQSSHGDARDQTMGNVPFQAPGPYGIYGQPMPGPHAQQPPKPQTSPGKEDANQLQHHHQPPLIPTGFIQGEHGLVPLYASEALDEYMTSGGGPHPFTQSQNRPLALDVQRSASTPVGHGTATAAWPHYAAYPAYPPLPSPGGSTGVGAGVGVGVGVGGAVPMLRGQSQPLPGQVQVPHPPTHPAHGAQGGWYAHPPPPPMNMNYPVPMPYYPHHQPPPIMHAPAPPSNAPSTSNAANAPVPVSSGAFVGGGNGGGNGNGNTRAPETSGNETPQRRYAQAQARGDQHNNSNAGSYVGQSQGQGHGQGHGQGQGQNSGQGQGQGQGAQQPHYVLHNYTNLDLQYSRGRNGSAGTVKQQHGHQAPPFENRTQAPPFENRTSGASAAGSASGDGGTNSDGRGSRTGKGSTGTGRSTPSTSTTGHGQGEYGGGGRGRGGGQ